MPVNSSIAKYGDPDFSNRQDFVNVFRNISLFSQIYNLVFQLPTATGTTSFTKQQTIICNFIPTGLHLTVLYSEVGRARARPIYQIVGANVKLVVE